MNWNLLFASTLLLWSACAGEVAPGSGSEAHTLSDEVAEVHALDIAPPAASALGLVLSEFAEFPRTSPTPAPTDARLQRKARINYIGEVPDGSGRLYVPDLNGPLYVLRERVPRVYADLSSVFAPRFHSGRGMGSGFGFVAFHPAFAKVSGSSGMSNRIQTHCGRLSACSHRKEARMRTHSLIASIALAGALSVTVVRLPVALAAGSVELIELKYEPVEQPRSQGPQ